MNEPIKPSHLPGAYQPPPSPKGGALVVQGIPLEVALMAKVTTMPTWKKVAIAVAIVAIAAIITVTIVFGAPAVIAAAVAVLKFALPYVAGPVLLLLVKKGIDYHFEKQFPELAKASKEAPSLLGTHPVHSHSLLKLTEILLNPKMEIEMEELPTSTDKIEARAGALRALAQLVEESKRECPKELLETLKNPDDGALNTLYQRIAVGENLTEQETQITTLIKDLVPKMVKETNRAVFGFS